MARTQSKDQRLSQNVRAALFPQTPYPTPGRFGVSRAIDDTRIGNTKRLAGFSPGTPVGALPTVRLLSVSLQQIAAAQGVPDAQWQSGSWVLALEANVTGQWVAGAPQVFCVCPLLAKIKMGIGDANIDVEMSPFPSASIPLACDSVEVDITWDPYHLTDYNITPNVGLAVPGEVEVTAIIQRSTGSSDARRVFVASPANTGVSLLGRVPSMAKSVMVYNSNEAEVYAAGAAFTLRAADPNTEINTGTAGIVTTYTGAQLGVIKNGGNLLQVPGAARWWLYTNAAANGGPYFVDWEIGL